MAAVQHYGGKLPALTGLRAVAAALILVEHSAYLRIPVPPWAFDHGVSLFFVLSGFILRHAYPELRGWRGVRNFLLLRVGRLWPAHVVAILLAAVAFSLAPFSRQMLACLGMVQAWIPSEPWYFAYNGPSWSISTEFGFYLLFPILLYRWRQSWWWKIGGAAALVAALVTLGRIVALPSYIQGPGVSLHGLLYVNPLARLLEFVMGMAAYSLFLWLRPRTVRLGFTAASAVELAVVAAAVWSISAAPIMEFAGAWFGIAGDWLAHTGSFWILPFVVVALGLGRGILSRLLATAPMVLFGELSYSVYLVHATVFSYYAQHLMPPGNASDYAGLAICIALSLGVAFLIWRLVETPVRYMVKRLVSRQAPGPDRAIAVRVPS
jgi:peptidoglycan/LPS O-acetylase OafA/YrhL